jgi:peptidoglycan lytic transglycosylase
MMNRLVLRWTAVTLICMLLIGCGTQSVRIEPGDSAPDQSVDFSAIPDAVPRYEARSRHGNPDSYVVFGKRYYVMRQSRGYVERGVASWYGTKFHGRKTSNGETYDMFAMTAAHKTLPIPSYLRVTNLGNGRSVIVRVNDRGPFHDSRIVDLSYVAAAKLGLHRTGTGRVEIRVIEPAGFANAVGGPASSPPPALYLQVGAFRDRENARRLLNRIKLTQLRASQIRIQPVYRKSETLFRVQVGPLASANEAGDIASQLRRLGIDAVRLVSERPKPQAAMIQ